MEKRPYSEREVIQEERPWKCLVTKRFLAVTRTNLNVTEAIFCVTAGFYRLHKGKGLMWTMVDGKPTTHWHTIALIRKSTRPICAPRSISFFLLFKKRHKSRCDHLEEMGQARRESAAKGESKSLISAAPTPTHTYSILSDLGTVFGRFLK